MAMSVSEKFAELEERSRGIQALRSISRLLEWDQLTQMPGGGGSARAEHVALIKGLAQEKLTNPELRSLLDELQNVDQVYGKNSDEDALVRVIERELEIAAVVPVEFMARFYEHVSRTYDVWTEARPADDFKLVLPYLERTLDLSREYAEYFPNREHIADPLIARLDFGMSTSLVREIFSELREALVPLVEGITAAPLPDASFLHQHAPAELQLEFAERVLGDFGYDFNRGRMDLSPHPFTTMFSIGDVRLTTRVHEDDLFAAISSCFHEAGHAMYEQGIHPRHEGTLIARGTSMALHESQSRLWENQVGRSKSFWSYYYPQLQDMFPEALADVSLDSFYKGINLVQRSLIRTEADEVTYNLHVMMRFDFEIQMLEGKLAVRDLPEAWRERMQSDLGIQPTDDKDGVLQDVHWFGDFIGGVFHSYTLGTILSAQFYEKATNAHPEIQKQMENGDFSTLSSWLKGNIYQYGSMYTMDELVQQVTGGPIEVEPYIRYLREKYNELYPGAL
jgi:carboxypeptidase Taq